MTSFLSKAVFFGVFLAWNSSHTSGASREDSLPHYDYIQIFKSIPSLFEYLLDALEERPEILEKNDVTTFTKRNLDVAENEEGETESKSKNNKREIMIKESQSEEVNENDIDVEKRKADDPETNTRSTVAYEYGNSNVRMKGVGEKNKDVSKRQSKNDEQNKKDSAGKFKVSNEDKKSMLKAYGENEFIGFEHLFGLDLKPEEIQEKVLEAEKLLEDYYNKKENNN